MVKTYIPLAGSSFASSCDNAIEFAAVKNCTVKFSYNSTQIWVIANQIFKALKPGFLEDASTFSKAIKSQLADDAFISEAPVLLMPTHDNARIAEAINQAQSFAENITLPIKLYFNGLAIDVHKDMQNTEIFERYEQAKAAYLDSSTYKEKWQQFCNTPDIRPPILITANSKDCIARALEKMQLLCRHVMLSTAHGMLPIGRSSTHDDIEYALDRLCITATTRQDSIDFYDTVLLPKNRIPEEPIKAVCELLPRAISRGEREIIKWASDFIVFQSRFPIASKQNIVDELKGAGFVSVHDKTPLTANTSYEAFAKNLVGQIIYCLEMNKKIPEAYRLLAKTHMVSVFPAITGTRPLVP